MNEERDQRMADTFVALADTLVDDFDIVDFLGLLAERAGELLGIAAAGVIRGIGAANSTRPSRHGSRNQIWITTTTEET